MCDMATFTRSPRREERRWDLQAEPCSRFQIDDEFKFSRLLNGQISRILPLSDSIDVTGRSLE